MCYVLIIERDNGEGTANRAYPEGQKRTDCFHNIAKFRLIYKIEKTDPTRVDRCARSAIPICLILPI